MKAEEAARTLKEKAELKRLDAEAAARQAEFDELMGKGKEEKKEAKDGDAAPASEPKAAKEESLIQSSSYNMDFNQPKMSQRKSDPIASSTGWLGPGHDPDAPRKPSAEEVVDYAHDRPLDHDIVTTHKNIANAEEALGHKFDLPKSAGLSVLASDMRSDPPWNSHDGYETRDLVADKSDLHSALNGWNIKYPEPELSNDIKDSQNALKSTEKKMGHKLQMAVQVASSGDVRSGVFSERNLKHKHGGSQQMAQMRERMMNNWGTK